MPGAEGLIEQSPVLRAALQPSKFLGWGGAAVPVWATTRRRLRLPAQSESNSDIAQILSLLYQIAFIFVEIGTSRNC